MKPIAEAAGHHMMSVGEHSSGVEGMRTTHAGASGKANVKHLARRVFGKSTDSSDRIILKEEDFKI